MRPETALTAPGLASRSPEKAKKQQPVRMRRAPRPAATAARCISPARPLSRDGSRGQTAPTDHGADPPAPDGIPDDAAPTGCAAGDAAAPAVQAPAFPGNFWEFPEISGFYRISWKATGVSLGFPG